MSRWTIDDGENSWRINIKERRKEERKLKKKRKIFSFLNFFFFFFGKRKKHKKNFFLGLTLIRLSETYFFFLKKFSRARAVTLWARVIYDSEFVVHS